MNDRTNAATVAGIAMMLGLLVAFVPVRADQAPTPIGALIEGSDRIVIGSVVDVRDARRPGEHLATVSIDAELLGSGSSTVKLLGSTKDPSRPRFFPGSRILAFLSSARDVEASGAGRESRPRGDMRQGLADIAQLNPPSSGGGARFIPVGKDQGIMLLGDASGGTARSLVTRAILKGSALRLADVRQFLAADKKLPPSLLGALFEQLSRGVTVQDASGILPMACQPGNYNAHAATWAVIQVGKLGLQNGRPCLESIVGQGSDRGLAILAVDALGDLGNPESAPLLVSLLAPHPIPPPLVLVDDEPSDVVGSHHDPEDDSNPVSDPGEDDDQIVPQPVTPENPLISGDEPFDGAADDDGQNAPGPPTANPNENETAEGGVDLPRRGVDGGLALAAVLALGKIGDPSTMVHVANIAREGDDLGLHSTVVRALGLFGADAMPQLNTIQQQHPNPLVRRLADQTMRRMQG